MTIRPYRGVCNAISRSARCSIGAAAVSALLIGAAGCGALPDKTEDPVEQDPLGRASSALIGTQVSSHTDWTGTVSIRVYRCDWVFGQHNSTDCTIPDADYAAVGGGGEILGSEQPGALLTGTLPVTDKATWRVNSKDHGQVYPHSLRAYEVGMKLTGVADLRSQIVIHYGGGGAISDYLGVGPDEILVGGGGFVVTEGPGKLLRILDFYPDYEIPGIANHVWVTVQENQFADPDARVFAAAIALPKCPPGYVGGCLQNEVMHWDGLSGGGYTVSDIHYIWGSAWAISAIGGIANREIDTPFNRFLTDVIPILSWTEGGVVWSKDHGDPHTGWSTATALLVARQ
jgi:hypothetical protein